MSSVVVKLVGAQREAVEEALVTYLRLCKRDLSCVTDLVRDGLVPVYLGHGEAGEPDSEVLESVGQILGAIQPALGMPATGEEQMSATARLCAKALEGLAAVGGAAEGGQLTLRWTLEEASAVAKGLDTYARLGIGQVAILLEMLRFGEMLVSRGGERQLAELRDISLFEASVDVLRQVLGFARGESMSIVNKNVDVRAHRAWEVCKVVRRAVTLHEARGRATASVWAQELSFRLTGDKAPEAVVEACT